MGLYGPAKCEEDSLVHLYRASLQTNSEKTPWVLLDLHCTGKVHSFINTVGPF